MAGGNDLQDSELGEPFDDVTPPLEEPEPVAVEVATETEAVVIAEDEVMAWPDAQPVLRPVQLALYAGWTMAVLYGTLADAATGRATLPTVNELAPKERRSVERERLGYLLTRLLPDYAGLADLSQVTVMDGDSEAQARRSKLESVNLDILTALTATRPDLQLAYELGRSLRDTANPPGGAEGISRQLDRGRVVKLQEWLLTLSSEFPVRTAAVVATSLGRWSDVAQVTATTSESMYAYLLRQGDVWLMLLLGQLATSGLLTPEGYVAAGEAALRRSGAILGGIFRHYWLGFLCVAVALGAILFLAARYLDGAGKVWTSIGGIIGALGVYAQTIASTSSRLAAEAERPVFAMAEDDAIAWAITTMPPLSNLTFRSVRHLRRAGVAPTASLGRF